MFRKIFKSLNKAHWDNVEYPIGGQILDEKIISLTLNKFWKENITPFITGGVKNSFLFQNGYLLIIFRVRFAESEDIKTLIKMQKIDITDKDLNNLKMFICLTLGVMVNEYFSRSMKSIIISWGIREKSRLKKPFISSLADMETDTIKSIKQGGVASHLWYKHLVPISTKLTDYGSFLTDLPDYKLIKMDSKTFLSVKIEGSKVEGDQDFFRFDYIKNGTKLFFFQDRILNESTVVRTIGQQLITYDHLVDSAPLVTMIKKVKKISPSSFESKIKGEIISADIETRIIDGKMYPYLLAFLHKGGFYYNFIKKDTVNGITDYSLDNLFKGFFEKLFTRRFRSYRIYFHNLSGFDSIFFFKYLIKYGYKVEPTIHNGKIILIEVQKGRNKWFIKDSYLLMLTSLEKLAKSFNVPTKKGIFPYFISDLNYQLKLGEYPDYNFFNTEKISLTEYNIMKTEFLSHKRPFSFRKESILYCFKDCKALFEVLIKFNKLIFENFKLNIVKSPTAPSLAFQIYRSSFMAGDQIGQISGKIRRDVKLSYTGGSTDMYIPYGENIHVYDVNSLYPSVMQEKFYPVGDPTYFIGDIFKKEGCSPNCEDSFGFFHCKITSPGNLKHPVLQLHHNVLGGIRTVSPLGTFTGWFFSEELKNAQKLGYIVEVLEGYKFEKAIIFNGYVERLYSLRTSYSKDHPMNYIAKILLNSLYGRFGMDDDFSDFEIISKKDYQKIKEEYLENIIDFGDHYLVKTKGYSLDKELDDRVNSNYIHNINISISSAVTAYARVHMSYFKNRKDLPNLYYTDTDSLYFDGPIPDKYIDNTKLGALKFEGKFKRGVFLAPKVYALEAYDGSLIIKIKGLSQSAIKTHGLTFNHLLKLLERDSFLEIPQSKWFKNLPEGTIQIVEQLYTLQKTDLKRKIIYSNDQMVDTTPLII